MKKSVLFGLFSALAIANQTFGQGTIFLDNYFTSGPNVTYGSPGIPANGVSGAQGTPGTGLLAGYTMGFYYALGNVVVNPDGTGQADPSTLGALTLATGSGSTAAFYTSSFNTPGRAFASSYYQVAGTAFAGGDTITVMVIAYSGANYASASWRAHSAAFTMTTSAGNSASPNATGVSMPAFAIIIPEPSVFALASLGASVLLLFRSKKT
jgi:hypothetical protein